MDKKKITLVSLGHLSCDINGGAIPALLPFLRAAYDLNYQAAAGLMLAFSCLSSVIQPIFGLLSDKHSKPWFIPLGVLLAGGGIAAVGFMHSYWAIFAAITVCGIGAALFHPEGARFANKVSGTSKGVGLSIFSVGGNAGFVLGPLLATWAMTSFDLPGTAVFGVLGLFTAAILVWQISRMRGDDKTSMPSQAVADNDMPAQPATTIATATTAKAANKTSDGIANSAGEIGKTGGTSQTHATVEAVSLASPINNWGEFSKLTLVIVCRSTLFVSLNTFIPLYWVSHYGQSKEAGVLALTFFCTCGVICNFAGGFWADRMGYLKIIRYSFAAAVPAVLLFGLVDNIYASYALLPFLGFALYAPFSSMVVLGQRYLAKNIGFASGVTLGLATTIGGIFAPVLGWVADNYGLPTALQCLTAAAIIALVASFVLNHTVSKTDTTVC